MTDCSPTHRGGDEGADVRRTKPHPKIAAVSDAIRPLLDVGEKVLMFRHHRATASELLGVLGALTEDDEALPARDPPEKFWRARRGSRSCPTRIPSCGRSSTGSARQVCGPRSVTGSASRRSRSKGSQNQIKTIRPRNAKSSVPTVLDSARTLSEVLLDQQSTSTRALLKGHR